MQKPPALKLSHAVLRPSRSPRSLPWSFSSLSLPNRPHPQARPKPLRLLRSMSQCPRLTLSQLSLPRSPRKRNRPQEQAVLLTGLEYRGAAVPTPRPPLLAQGIANHVRRFASRWVGTARRAGPRPAVETPLVDNHEYAHHATMELSRPAF